MMATQAPSTQNLSEIFVQFRQELKEVENKIESLFSKLLRVRKGEGEEETAPYPEMELQSGVYKMDDKVERSELATGRWDLKNASLESLIFVVVTPLETFVLKTNVTGEYWVSNGLPISLELYSLILNPKADRFYWGGEALSVLRDWKKRRRKREEKER